MKAFEIAESFRVLFAAAPTFTGVLCRNEQSGEKGLGCPALIFSVTDKALNSSGSALSYTLTIWVESVADRAAESDPTPQSLHAARVDAVRALLLGTGRSGLLTALNAVGAFDFRGWDAAESDPGIEDRYFRTPVSVTGTVLVL